MTEFGAFMGHVQVVDDCDVWELDDQQYLAYLQRLVVYHGRQARWWALQHRISRRRLARIRGRQVRVWLASFSLYLIQDVNQLVARWPW